MKHRTITKLLALVLALCLLAGALPLSASAAEVGDQRRHPHHLRHGGDE